MAMTLDGCFLEIEVHLLSKDDDALLYLDVLKGILI